MTWLGKLFGLRQRGEGESCASCCHFIDHSDPNDDPDEVNGYCGYLVDTWGLEKALQINEYGGHWAHSGEWCPNFEGGETLWKRDPSLAPEDQP